MDQSDDKRDLQSAQAKVDSAPPAKQVLPQQLHRLYELSARALARPPSQQAIEYQGRWITWGELRQVANRMAELIDISGADPGEPVAFVPRNRPSAIAALLGLIAKGRTVRMLY